MKVAIAVTHLLGAGHLSRAAALGRAFAKAGHEVTLLSGGRATTHLDFSGLNFVQLPSVGSDGIDFSTLLDEEGSRASTDYMETRLDIAVQAMRSAVPDAMITELFPFGRRVLAQEFLALLDAVRDGAGGPVVLSSVRDILAPPSKPEKAERTARILNDCYDGVLVHSDQRLVDLSQSWPVTPDVRTKLYYTGFVAPDVPQATQATGSGEIVVSAGGGNVGDRVFETAIEAARQGNRTWRLLVGGSHAGERIARLCRASSDAPVLIEALRPDFRQLLMNADASVSLCGYNTAMDILQTGVPAVLVPFDDGGEVEQTLRATALKDQPAIELLTNADLDAETLAAAIDRVIGQGRRDPSDVRVDGAAQSVRIVERLVEARG